MERDGAATVRLDAALEVPSEHHVSAVAGSPHPILAVANCRLMALQLPPAVRKLRASVGDQSFDAAGIFQRVGRCRRL
jgi:hypothetical protein